jgi:hypothetical protein
MSMGQNVFTFAHLKGLTIPHPLELNGCASFYVEIDKRLS